MKRCLLAFLTTILTISGFALPVSALEFMTYNILNYSSGRTSEFQTSMLAANPDILVVQEILSLGAVDGFLNNVLNYNNPGEWAAGDFHNGYDTDNAIFYRTAKVQYISHAIINTQLREIDEWTIRPVGYESEDANLRIYTVHLKASQGSTNEAKRLGEVQAMRVRMESFPAGQNYIVTGDFNIYDSYESAYSYMLGSSGGLAGIVEDPIDAPGNWHNSYSFAYLHTQSPRTTSFGGGSTGGMDDRFDMILSSPALRDGSGFEIIPATYTPFGNDGAHFNHALTDPPAHPTLSPAVITALHNGSDHLPVTVEFSLPAILLMEDELDLGVTITGTTPSGMLTVENGADDPADDLTYQFSPSLTFSTPSGEQHAAPDDGPRTHPITLTNPVTGFWSDDLIVTTNAPDMPGVTVSLSATVLDHANPSIDENEVITVGEIDFGTFPGNEVITETATIFNLGYNDLQAALEIYDVELSGDSRFFLTEEFSPLTITDQSESWAISFDGTDAVDGTYEGMIVFSTRDQQDLVGAALLADLSFSLMATVDAGSADVDTPELSGLVGLSRAEPNPFAQFTSLTYHLPATGPVKLVIFDISGRQVRTLINNTQAAGTYQLEWDGLNDSGQDLGTGIFFSRFVTEELQQTRVIARIR